MDAIFGSFYHYTVEIIPAIIFGFLLSGLVHEFVPAAWVDKYLGERGIRPILYAAIAGTFLPICCWGSLPVAVSFQKKGARLGPILAFLVATPATSISALVVTLRLLGWAFTIYIFFAVILLGITMGLIGNVLKIQGRGEPMTTCPHCEAEKDADHVCKPKRFMGRIKGIVKFAFVDMVKDIGPSLLVGLALAALVDAYMPLGRIIKLYLGGALGYLFSLLFGLVMYICSTASVPLVDAFIKQGMSEGAGLVLLIVGPVTSFGTILVLRKEFGFKVLFAYLAVISIGSLALGYIFSLIR